MVEGGIQGSGSALVWAVERAMRDQGVRKGHEWVEWVAHLFWAPLLPAELGFRLSIPHS